MHEWLDTILELGILVFIIKEHYFGRPDIHLKTEEKQRKRLRKKYEMLPPEGESK